MEVSRKQHHLFSKSHHWHWQPHDLVWGSSDCGAEANWPATWFSRSCEPRMVFTFWKGCKKSKEEEYCENYRKKKRKLQETETSVSLKKVFLEYSHAHSFLYCLGLFCATRVVSTETVGTTSSRAVPISLNRKSLLTPIRSLTFTSSEGAGHK